MRWALEKFNTWFGSSIGVWQTVILCALLVVAERLHPNLDPSGFQLLYWLTVYSAVTQPVLAHGNNKSAAKMEALEQQILETEQKILSRLATPV